MAEAATKPVRCAIYTRKSTEEGLEQAFNSLDAQREDDGGSSGANIERPALQRFLEDLNQGRIDCVVVYKVARLSRSLLDFARLMKRFDRRGVVLCL